MSHKTNVLITASIGLYVDNKGQYYIQVLTAENYNNYILPIPKDEADIISLDEDLEIAEYNS